MSIVPEPGPRAAPHVVVVGNHKGGSGKSTVAMHLIIALLKAGKRVASFDLDVTQQTLTHYIDNRRDWARRNGLALELPRHCSIAARGEPMDRSDAADVGRFAAALATLGDDHDFVIIDTPGGVQHLSLIAHGMADTLVTPINDSFVDLDVIVAIGPSRGLGPQPSQYAGTVARALEGRRNVCGRSTDWILVRNRIAPLAARNREIADLLETVGARLGFRTATGLSERLVFRDFFPVGLTAFDELLRPVLGLAPSTSHLVARLEVRDLLEQIGLLARQPEPEGASDGAMPADEGVQAAHGIAAPHETLAEAL